MVIDFITNDMNATVCGFLDDGFNGFPRVNGASGVAGGIQYYGKRIGPHGVDDFLGIKLVIVLGAGGDVLYRAAVHADQRAIKHERGVGNDKLAAWSRGGGECQIDCFGSAGGDHQVFRHQRTSVAGTVIIGQRFQ